MKSTTLFFVVIIGGILLRVGDSLKCYQGTRFITGQKIEETTECSSSLDFCYKIQADASVLTKVKRLGCSTIRCQLARNTCMRTEISGVPVQLCCCSEDLCNKA
ncbi:hypothetical protein AB6A40_003244 [Gnathostoma spinigerum]|uniref:Uncharacterized protein n=1 Tax=Gnathostoma spinigerum TaxID=75299 RepID=A0ABD6E8Y7_9BILA